MDQIIKLGVDILNNKVANNYKEVVLEELQEICSNCNNKITPLDNFCGECGTKISEICKFCWVKKQKKYNCGYSKCPGFKLFLIEIMDINMK